MSDIRDNVVMFVEDNRVALVLTVIPFIASVVISVVIYRRQRRDKEPYWAIRTSNLVRGYSSQIGGLEIAYQGQAVRSLSVSRVLVWNAGAVTIDEQDLNTADPLRLTGLHDTKILDAKTVQVSGKPKKMELVVSPAKDYATVAFDYLGPRKGGVFQVLHTGTSSKDLTLEGELRDGRPLRQKTEVVGSLIPFPSFLYKFDIYSSLTMRRHRDFPTVMGITLISASIVFILLGFGVIGDNQVDNRWIFLVIFPMYSLVGLWILIRTWARPVPKELGSFFEEIFS